LERECSVRCSFWRVGENPNGGHIILVFENGLTIEISDGDEPPQTTDNNKT
jgi:hypothetical protein